MDKKYNLKELKIEVTQKCPLNCLHCSSEANISKSRELSFKQVASIIDEAKELGAREITFSGGEPLLWQPIPDAISHCTQYKIPTVIYTTGISINEHPSLLHDLLRSGLKKVVVSLLDQPKKFTKA
jgi:MoaA/NifB/PqqE/SkfB family radical SAM enzyme